MEEQLEPTEVAALYALHAEELRSFLRGVLREPSLVQDVLQLTFVKLIEQGGNSREETRKAWLFRVAFNQARQIRRQGANRDRLLREQLPALLPQSSPDPSEHFVRFERVEQVQQALGQLTFKQMEVVRLRVYEELTFKEIAQRLKLPLGTVLSRMRAAMHVLRSLLAEDADSP